MSRNSAIATHQLKQITHPKDRKLDQLQKKMRHNTKIEGYKSQRKSIEALGTARVFYIRCQCAAILANHPDAHKNNLYTPELLEALILLHISRNDEEVALLKLEKRRPQHGRISLLEDQKKHETMIFGSKGFLVPDITDPEVREILLDVWDGDARLVSCVPLKNVCRQGLDIAATEAMLRQVALDINEVREKEVEEQCANAKSIQFRTETPVAVKKAMDNKQRAADRKVSVKKGSSVREIHEKEKEKRMLQSRQRSSQKRHAAMAKSRGLI